MIGREQMVEQSVTDYVKAALFGPRGYDPAKIELLESFPYTQEGGVLDEKNLVALGFNVDDGGVQAECGSDLKRRVYTLQFFVFGLTNTWARNLANQIKFAIDHDGIIPLKDYAQPGAPVVDSMIVESVSAERQIIPDPEPWQEFCWTCHAKVADEYHAALV